MKAMQITYNDYYQLAQRLLAPLTAVDDNVAVRLMMEKRGIERRLYDYRCRAAVHNFGALQMDALCYVTTVGGKAVGLCFESATTDDIDRITLDDEALPIAPFNIDILNPNWLKSQPEMLIVTNSERDCLTLMACGYPMTIAIHGGKGSDPESSLAPFREWLDPLKRVLVCCDNTHAGRSMRNRLRQILSLDYSVGVTRLDGAIDFTSLYMYGGKEAVQQAIIATRFTTSREIVFVGTRVNGVKEVLRGNYDHGFPTGMGALTDRHLMLTDEGGLIVVTGKPNCGKTDWCRCLTARLMCSERRFNVCFCSFEEPNKEKHVAHFVRLVTGENHTEDMDDTNMDNVLLYLDAHMVNLDMCTTPPTPSNIMRLADEASRVRRVDMLYIDPYLYLEPDRPIDNETQQIKQMLTSLQAWARRRKVWVVVVAHPRKLQKDAAGKYEEVDEYTVAGSAHWANVCDFLLSVKRVFPSELCDDDAGSANPSYTVVSVLKVRDQEICHTGRMYYIRMASGRYVEMSCEKSCLDRLRQTIIHGTDDAAPWIDVR